MKRPSGGVADALYTGNEDIVAAVIERAELHKTIWRIANDLRGSVDVLPLYLGESDGLRERH